ncbi:MAG: hypothetical protein EXS01_00995 [Phycisphaerales bacterium]|nr:hypothetical protein [Phycisphaerales bacterium]
MNEFYVDLLPDDARRILRERASFRLVKLSGILALTIVTGVAINSYVELRNARAEYEVFAQLRDRASKIDEMVAKSTQERTTLRGEIAVDAILRSPVSASEIIATISHLLPEGSWLESMKISLEETKLAKGAISARPAYLILMNGIAPTPESVQELASSLRKTPPFTAVTVLEQRAAARTSGGSEQQFVMRARIDPTAAASAPAAATRPWAPAVTAHAASVEGGGVQ